MTDSAEPTVLVRTEHSLGRITLNRPRAINALDPEMIERITTALQDWRDDSDIQCVLIDGEGERGLCAGGDVRALYDQIVGGRTELTEAFFRAEYAMNAMIAEYPKPVVAFADGITMGGGIGLAGHAAVRIVTERSRLAMPETRIGFTPDVGGTWLLGRAPGRLGEYLGLTGTSMNAADAIYAGFADHYVPSDRLDALRDALAHRADPGTPNELVLLFDETPEPSSLIAARSWVDDAFAADSVAEILDRLDAREEPDAAAAAATLRELAPTGLAVTLDAVREARAMSGVREALEGEYRRVIWFVHHHPDLVEGIRAQLVDKDRQPKWQPASIAELAPDAGAPAREYVPEPALFSAVR
ncbi:MULTISPECIES: enoyl-CoA hydratase/isomerase family protein [Microbacterium]|uniref:enoyl-CoA hydratase/isomerase family protein n=1 Tax=Microbacterium TaxID=33882 RepID=UPI00217E904D|nr:MULTISPECIES: enoyl-CoA hydratase/isomerase family protein [Microbacterium]UWF77373.1 enoyl-CoA hydratase/isomerase family protein [Microbacterium neungamense]WCM55535.1 enoyl-CoA hydratase/isomerase family protein [Microbacterium sp. EF45047]